MKRVAIGDSERDLETIDASWVREKLDSFRGRGMPRSVKVTIQSESINVTLATPAPATVDAQNEAPNQQEQRIIDFWLKRGMDQADFTLCQLIAFLDQIKHV